MHFLCEIHVYIFFLFYLYSVLVHSPFFPQVNCTWQTTDEVPVRSLLSTINKCACRKWMNDNCKNITKNSKPIVGNPRFFTCQNSKMRHQHWWKELHYDSEYNYCNVVNVFYCCSKCLFISTLSHYVLWQIMFHILWNIFMQSKFLMFSNGF